MTGIGRMPLGLIALAALCSANGFEQITVIDDDARRDDKDFAKRIAETDPDVVALTTWLGGFPDIKRLRRVLPGTVPIVVGGALATVIPEFHLYQGADIVIAGEGSVFLDVLQSIKKSRSFLTHTIHHQSSKLVPSAIESLDLTLGYPFFPMDIYKNKWPGGKRGGMIITTIGCPCNCPFCTPNLMGGFRTRPLASIQKEVAFLQREYGMEDFYIADATFTADAIHAKGVCGIMKEAGVTWFCETRADRLVEGIAETMANSNCRGVLLGLESASLKIDEGLRGGKSKEKVARAIKMLRRFGITPGVFVLFGLPGETAETIAETLAFIKEMNISCSPNVLFPIPGTPIWKMAEEKGLLSSLEDYLFRLNKYNEKNRAFVSVPGMCEASPDVIEKAVRDVWRHNETVKGW